MTPIEKYESLTKQLLFGQEQIHRVLSRCYQIPSLQIRLALLQEVSVQKTEFAPNAKHGERSVNSATLAYQNLIVQDDEFSIESLYGGNNLNDVWRKAAAAFHPDRNPEGAHLFDLARAMKDAGDFEGLMILIGIHTDNRPDDLDNMILRRCGRLNQRLQQMMNGIGGRLLALEQTRRADNFEETALALLDTLCDQRIGPNWRRKIQEVANGSQEG